MKTSLTYLPHLNNLVRAFMGGGAVRQQAERDQTQSLMNQDYLRARMAAEGADARMKAAQAEGLERRNAYTGPEGEAQYLADMAGLTLPQAQRYLDHEKTGNWGTRSVPVEGPTQDGGALSTRELPITETPEDMLPMLRPFMQARQTWAAMQGAGNANPEQIAGAHGLYQSQGASQRAQQLVEDGDYDRASAVNQAGVPGNPIRVHANIGDTGATYAPGSGSVQGDSRTNALLKSTLERNNAAAAKSRADAAVHRGKGNPPAGAPGVVPPGLPEGAKQVGTSNGKAVYEAADGSRYIQR